MCLDIRIAPPRTGISSLALVFNSSIIGFRKYLGICEISDYRPCPNMGLTIRVQGGFQHLDVQGKEKDTWSHNTVTQSFGLGH